MIKHFLPILFIMLAAGPAGRLSAVLPETVQNIAARYQTLKTTFEKDRSATALKELSRAAISIPEVHGTPDWQEVRTQKLDLLLTTVRLAYSAVDPAFDAKDTFVLHVVPPAAAGVDAGTDPEAVTDPVARAEYKEAIEKNHQKAVKYTDQMDARGYYADVSNYTRAFIARNYSPQEMEIVKSTVHERLGNPALETAFNEVNP